MCGIAGFIPRRRMEPSRGGEIARRMAQALVHRGPDDLRVWESPSGRCILGHTRLRVIDLETGGQPMASPDGQVQVVYNGEVYNFQALRRTLEGRGFVFRTRSDTEVVLQGYRAWGPDLVRRLDGMFAFAIWDESRDRLLLARDRAGQKPLFLYRGPEGVAFASEIKAIFASGMVPVEPDARGLWPYLVHGYVPGPGTLFAGVEQLPPAYRALVDGSGHVERTRYWDLPRSRASVSTTRARRDVRRLLESAVERRLVSDVPLGAFLSGGLDSAVVVGLMSRLRTDPIRTFSVGFRGAPGYDESDAAAETARHFGTRHTAFHLDTPAPDLLDDLVRIYDEPFGDSSAIPTWTVSQLARSEVTVALSGDGGDELFAGYDRFRAMVLADRLPSMPVRFLGRAAAHLPAPTDFRHPLRRGVRFLGAAGLPPLERWLAWVGDWPLPPGLLRGEDPAGGSTRDPLASLREMDPPGEASRTSLDRALRLNFRTYLPGDLLVKADRCSMAHGLELRSPFLDRELTEYAFTLPDRLKLRRGEGKAILRDAVRDLVPAAVLDRPKRGFAVPLGAWLRGPWRSLLTERLLQPGARIRHWLDPVPVQALVQQHLTERADHGHFLWKLLTLESWLEQHR